MARRQSRIGTPADVLGRGVACEQTAALLQSHVRSNEN